MSLVAIKKKAITLLLALSLLFLLINGPTMVPDTVYAGDCTMDTSTSC
jgi:hypothetical protein